MRPLLLAAAVLALVAGCGSREARTKIVKVDGHEFLCSYTHNNISGNESEQHCAAVPEDGP